MNSAELVPYPLVRTNQSVIVVCVLLSAITGSGMWLLIPLLAGLSGFLVGVNPILFGARLFLRRPPSTYAGEDRSQMRFNQSIAVTLLSAGFVSYLAHWYLFAYLATALVGIAAMVAMSGFCVGCFIRYQWGQYRYRRNRDLLKD